MDRMEHVHGKLVAGDGDRILVESVDAYLGFHARSNGSKEYYGYFELPSDQCTGLSASTQCRLVLDDGRIGDIYTDVHPSNSPGKILAEFHVSGKLHK